jgi:hypothetical protein
MMNIIRPHDIHQFPLKFLFFIFALKRIVMSTKKVIGVYLDHQKAYLIQKEKEDAVISEIIESDYERQVREAGKGSNTTFWNASGTYSSNNENNKNNKAKNQLHEYYELLSRKIKDFDEILIFGPTTARNELKNYLCELKPFNGKKIHVEPADILTDNQKREKVRNFFNGN